MASVYVSGIIEASIEQVWAVARDFNGHGEWHPFIAESHIEDGLASDTVGCIRNFTLANGGHLREQLLSLSDLDHCFTYSILASPMPIRDYRACFRLTPVTEGDRTFVEWSAQFEVDPADEARIKEQVGRTTFAEGIAAIARRVSKLAGD